MASLLKRFFSRYGIMRPTKKVPFKKGKKVKKKDMPTWRTQDKWYMLFFVGYPINVKGDCRFHWDLNPWKWTQVGWDETKEQKSLTPEQRAESMLPPHEFILRNDIYIDWKDPFRVAITLITENNENNDFHGFDKVEVPTQ